VTVHQLELTGVEAETVLLSDERGGTVEAIRITVYGRTFPQRALLPELWVGKERAERVTIAPDGRSLRGYLRARPPDQSSIVVRYGASQRGTLDRVLRHRLIRPLPKGCPDAHGGLAADEEGADAPENRRLR
jgi:hypothetical protein